MHQMMNHPVVKKMYNKDLGLLLIRIALGVAFISHGLQKIENIHGTVSFFFTLGLPAFMAYVVAAVEFLGGIAMVLGVCARFFGILLAIDMIGVFILVSSKFVAMRGFSGFELEFILFMLSLGIAFAGSGAYALMSRSCGDCCKGGICTEHEMKK